MNISQSLIPEYLHEAGVTRKYLERFPEDKADWKPHAKSMSMAHLATHIAGLAAWVPITLDQDELDLAGYKPEMDTTREALLARFDAGVESAKKSMESKDDAGWMGPWSLKQAGHTLFTMPKIAVYRSFCINHLIHHRAQLGVYFRLLDIPVPATYGPSADDQGM